MGISLIIFDKYQKTSILQQYTIKKGRKSTTFFHRQNIVSLFFIRHIV